MALLINQESQNLKDRLNYLVSKSHELKFLLGFFYFSGFQEISENIKNNKDLNDVSKIKILIGLDVDEYNNSLIEIGNNSTHVSNHDIVLT